MQGNNKTAHGSARYWSATLIAALMLSAAPAAWAKTVYVANNGLDNGVCGGKPNPCRSISQAIDNALAGDTISVGPGRYAADLDYDGNLGELGEEQVEENGGCHCMIHVSKELTITSSAGARRTVLDVQGMTDIDGFAILIDAAAVVLGKPNKGFTIVDTSGDESISGVRSTADTVTIAGNDAVARYVGFSIEGSNSTLKYNRAERGSRGFEEGNGAASNTYTGNWALATSFTGFSFTANSGFIASHNAAIGGETGFSIPLVGNDTASFHHNSALGNVTIGIEFSGIGGETFSLAKNNIWGNGAVNSNCGLYVSNVFGLGFINVDATNNFWGAAAGPGIDPADNACTGAGVNLTISPSATAEINVKPKAFK